MKAPLLDRGRTPWIALVIALAFVAVATFGIITYRNTIAVRQGEASIAHSYAVRETTRELLSSVKDMETGQRGFMLTGASAYLEPYQAGLAKIAEEFARLRKLVQDNPARQRRLDQLQQLVDARQTLLAQAIKLRSEDARPARFDQASTIVMAEHGRQLMDEMRGLVDKMLEGEQQLQTAKEAAAESRATATGHLIIAGNLIALALIVLSGIAIHIDRKKRNEAEAQLRFSQAELGAIFDSAGEHRHAGWRDFA